MSIAIVSIWKLYNPPDSISVVGTIPSVLLAVHGGCVSDPTSASANAPNKSTYSVALLATGRAPLLAAVHTSVPSKARVCQMSPVMSVCVAVDRRACPARPCPGGSPCPILAPSWALPSRSASSTCSSPSPSPRRSPTSTNTSLCEFHDPSIHVLLNPLAPHLHAPVFGEERLAARFALSFLLAKTADDDVA